MKKIISILLIISLVVLLPVFASGEYASKTDDELMAELNKIRAELVQRAEKKDAKQVLVDADGVTVTLKGEPEFKEMYDGTHYIVFNLTVVNTSDIGVGVRTDECYVNGWKIGASFNSNLEPGMKEKDTLEIYNLDSEAEVEKLEDLEDIKLTFLTFKSEDFHTLTRDIEATITFK